MRLREPEELRSRGAGSIIRSDLRLFRDDRADRVVLHGLAVRQATAHANGGLGAPRELADQAGLADPSVSEDRHQVWLSLASDPSHQVVQERELGVAADHRSLQSRDAARGGAGLGSKDAIDPPRVYAARAFPFNRDRVGVPDRTFGQ